MSNSNDNDNLVLEEACRVVDRAYRRIRVDRQYRRLRTALRKLGITQIVGDSWVSIDEESVEIRFGSVPKHRFAMLVEHLVDVAEEVEYPEADRVPVGAPGSHRGEQLQLDLGLDFLEGTDPQAGGRS